MTRVTKSAAKPMATAVIRWLIVVVGVFAVAAVVFAYHKHIWQAVAGSAAALSALAWSLAQKVWAARDKWAAYLAEPPSKPPAVVTAKPLETTMDLPTLLKDALDAAEAVAGPAIRQTLDAAVAGAQQVADAEVAQAKNELPPALAPLAPTLAALADDEIAKLTQDVQAKVDAWSALKGAVAS